MNDRNDNRRRVLRTAALFCLLTVAGNLVIYLLAVRGGLAPVESTTAAAAVALMRLTGLQAAAAANIIHLSGAVWLVDVECTAIHLLVLFTAFILAYPAPRRAKAIGLLAGPILLMAANLGRLLAMAWVEEIWPHYAESFHDYVWQVLFLALVALLWLTWIEQVVARASRPSLSP
jgi:exosortase/archaeosortase family protein